MTQSLRQPQTYSMEVNPGGIPLEASHIVLPQVSKADDIYWPLYLLSPWTRLKETIVNDRCTRKTAQDPSKTKPDGILAGPGRSPQPLPSWGDWQPLASEGESLFFKVWPLVGLQHPRLAAWPCAYGQHKVVKGSKLGTGGMLWGGSGRSSGR